MTSAPLPSADQEVEFKLVARGRLAAQAVVEIARAAGLDVGPAQDVRQTDHYFDTACFDLLRRGAALRLREHREGTALCFKGAAVDEGDALRRLEVEIPLPRDAPAPRSALDLPGRLRDLAEPATLTRPLAEVARVDNRRTRIAVLHLMSGAQAELCIDRVHSRASDGSVRSFVEVEIEAKKGGAATFAPLASELAARLRLDPSRVSKLERALAGTAHGAPQPHLQRPGLQPEMAFREAAARVMRVGFEALRAAEPVARLGDDDEGVHRMRVATRRLRAAFRIFAPAFPPKRLESARRLFGRTGRALGPVRDLDVMLARLPALSLDLPEPLAAELTPLFDLLVSLRDEQRRRMLAWLGSPVRLRAMERFDGLLSRLERRYAIGPDAAPPVRRRRRTRVPSVGEIAPELLHAAARRVLEKGDRIAKHSPPEALHALRIAVKRLRYTSEALEDVSPRDVVVWLKQTSKLQETLGAYNDARVMEARLTAWMDTPAGRRLPRKTLLAVGGLLGVQERRARDARKEFRRQWREFSRDKWRRRLERTGDGPPPEEAGLEGQVPD